MSDFINSFFTKNKTALLVFLFFGCVCGAVFRWEDVPFDVLNYHYYNPWAFLNDRINVDVVPAGVNTFYSPFIDFPFYFLINALNGHPVIFSAVMSVPYGLMLFAAYKIAALFFPGDTGEGRIRIGLSVLLFVCSDLVFSQISSASHEHLMSFFVLTALYLLLKDIKGHKTDAISLVLSGFLLGGGRIETDVRLLRRGERDRVDRFRETNGKTGQNRSTFHVCGDMRFFDFIRILGMVFMDAL